MQWCMLGIPELGRWWKQQDQEFMALKQDRGQPGLHEALSYELGGGL